MQELFQCRYRAGGNRRAAATSPNSLKGRVFLDFRPWAARVVPALYKRGMTTCEIIYFKDAKGWKWRALGEHGEPKPKACEETYQLFFECVMAARARGMRPPRVVCS